MRDPPQVQSLWIGERLSPVERVALASFLAHGHPVRLWTYGPVDGVPEGVELAPAEEILSIRHLFGVGPRIDGRRSPSSFADWFRVELMEKSPALWIDLDVVCLRPLTELPDGLVVGQEVPGVVCNAVLRLEPGPLLDLLLQSARNPHRPLPWHTPAERRGLLADRVRSLGRARVLRSRRGWGGIAGPSVLTRALLHLDLIDRALPVSAFYAVHWEDFRRFLEPGGTELEEELLRSGSGVAHLWNERWRVGGVGKDDHFPADSFFEIQRRRYL